MSEAIPRAGRDLDPEAFVRRARDDIRTLEEHHTTELLVDACLSPPSSEELKAGVRGALGSIHQHQHGGLLHGLYHVLELAPLRVGFLQLGGDCGDESQVIPSSGQPRVRLG